MKLAKVFYFVFVLVSFCCFSVGANSTPAFKGGVFEPASLAPKIELTGSNGTPVKLSDYKGKIVLIEFGFTTCKQVCPFTLSVLAQVFSNLGDDAKKVQVLFVTVDPERDTPDKLKSFLAMFNPSFVGATGTPKQLKVVNDSYGILTSKVRLKNGGKEDYEVHHSSSVYVIDAKGRLRLLLPFGKSAKDIEHDLRLLLSSDI